MEPASFAARRRLPSTYFPAPDQLADVVGRMALAAGGVCLNPSLRSAAASSALRHPLPRVRLPLVYCGPPIPNGIP